MTSADLPGGEASDRAGGLSGSCRGCGATVLELVVDLGVQPPAEQFLDRTDLAEAEAVRALRIVVCRSCWLVQLEGEPVAAADEPGGLAFTVSPTMRAHVEGLVDDALSMSNRRSDLTVVEVASHGNRLHDLFANAGAESTLIEAMPGYARAAVEAGVPTIADRLTPQLAARMLATGPPADVFLDAFYLAHDPRPREYLAGVASLLAADGIAVFEFDHLLPIVLETQYDGFRHGHASYLSLGAFEWMLAEHGLVTVDARPTSVYGGSLRVFVAHGTRAEGGGSQAVRAAELEAGLTRLETFRTFAGRVERLRKDLRAFLDACRADGLTVAAYGAPSRGNTLRNSSAATCADILFAVDRSPSKQGRYLPGSRIPIVAPATLAEARPDYLLILTWDLLDEVVPAMAHIRDWGGRFVVPLPALSVID